MLTISRLLKSQNIHRSTYCCASVYNSKSLRESPSLNYHTSEWCLDRSSQIRPKSSRNRISTFFDGWIGFYTLRPRHPVVRRSHMIGIWRSSRRWKTREALGPYQSGRIHMRSKLYLLGAEVYESIHRVQRMSNQFLDLLELSAFVTAKFVRLLLQVPSLQKRGYVPSSSCFFTYLLSFLKYRFMTGGFSLFPRPDSNPFLRGAESSEERKVCAIREGCCCDGTN